VILAACDNRLGQKTAKYSKPAAQGTSRPFRKMISKSKALYRTSLAVINRMGLLEAMAPGIFKSNFYIEFR